MVVTKTVHWGNAGTEPAVGVDDDYAVNEQPVAEWDNWFNKATETDIAALITALQDTTTGHDHDGANSNTVDASDVVNTPAGDIVATDVQAAITELDSGKTVINTSSYAGNNSANRAIAHGNGKKPWIVLINRNTDGALFDCLKDGYINSVSNALHFVVTTMDATNFYVGNASSYDSSANATGITYTWVAIS